MGALETLIQIFHGTMPQKELSRKAFSMRQHLNIRYLFLLEAIVSYYTSLLLASGLLENILQSIFAFVYWIILLDSIIGFFLMSKALVFTPCSRGRIESQSKCNLVSLL